jgi:hypothetical protein
MIKNKEQRKRKQEKIREKKQEKLETEISTLGTDLRSKIMDFQS